MGTEGRMSYYVYITRQSQLYVAEVPALPGCRTIGRSEAEVLENIKSVVEGYLETLKRTHRSLPRVKVVKVCEEEFTSLKSG
jgi:predicted RNase H-like HicB family nuclease